VKYNKLNSMAIDKSTVRLCLYTCLGLLLGLAVAGTALGQTTPDSLGGLASKFSRYQRLALPEKLFLHLDRPLYLSGETMWFKIYAVEGTYSQPMPLSKVAYVEVLDKQNRPVLQGKVPVKHAVGQGSFSLPSSLASGVYTVRAYTNWMQNFGPESYFQASVTVVNTFTASGTVAGKDSAAYDVQFFPEGGNLVQGLSSKVAFKATNKAGTGVAAEGKLLNQSGAVVATFKTLRFGMGSFTFKPEAGNTYTALVTIGKASTSRYTLPRIYEQGYVMRLENSSPEVLTLTVSSTSTQPETVFLLGHSRQKVAVAARGFLVDGRVVFSIDKKQLVEGISHFTLFSEAQKPLCERLYFQRPYQALGIIARPDKSQYTSREQVRVELTTAALGNLAPQANLSMAVYRLDSLATAPTADITSYLWLTSDLKGTVEHPDYYFTATDPEVTAATDNLLLTQGWSRFRWEQVLGTPPVFSHLPELNGPLVQGRLTQRGTNIPVKGIASFLSVPNRIIRLQNCMSGEDGSIRFELNNVYGAQDIIVQTDPRQDSTCQIEIFNPFSTQYAAAPQAHFVAHTRFQSDYAQRHFQNQVQNVYAPKGQNRYLMPPPADSLAFYGKADETYLLDKYTRFKVLEEVMREYVPGVVVRIRKDGFHFLVIDKINNTLLGENPMVLLDGVPIFNINKMMAMDPLKIQKLEVIDSRYFQGLSMYNGVVSYTTYKGDLDGFPLDPRVLVQQYEGLQGQREFYAPRYNTPQAKQSRLPDLRNLLYWNPNITTTGTTASQLEFYTGDQAGRYMVVLQGLSSTGLAGSTSFTFEVKQAL
jgi:hypothetical protein